MKEYTADVLGGVVKILTVLVCCVFLPLLILVLVVNLCFKRDFSYDRITKFLNGKL
jgi:hypothetical protein